MLQYTQKIPIHIMSRHMAWRNVKYLNQILHFRNLKGFQTVHRLSKSADILEEALMTATFQQLSKGYHFPPVTIIEKSLQFYL